MWAYFVKNKMFYSSDVQLVKRFLDPAPFSKFFLPIDKESPGQVGEWIGYKIVQSYVRNNQVSLAELCKPEQSNIFLKKSKYKPKQ
jgi:hypothetical protein